MVFTKHRGKSGLYRRASFCGAVFCLVVFLLSGCAGSAGGGRSSSAFSSQEELTSGSGSSETSPTNIGGAAAFPGIPAPPFKYPIAIDLPSDNPPDFKYPIAIDLPPDDNSEPRPFKYPIAIDVQPEVLKSPCEDSFRYFPGSVRYYRCNRARVPGLTPLYDMVSERVSASVEEGKEIKKIGVIIDTSEDSHGDSVMQTAKIATREELFDYFDIRALRTSIKGQFMSLNKDQYRSQSPIVNISASPVFTSLDSLPSFISGRITLEDMQNVGALVVTSAGNQGRARLLNVPAINEINEGTGSVLVVAGLHHLSGSSYLLPLTNEKGFHRGYVTDSDGNPLTPEIGPDSNLCGGIERFCVTAPYSIFNSVQPSPLGEGDLIINGESGTSLSSPLVFGTLVSLRYVWPHLTNRQLVRLSCVTAVDLGAEGSDPIFGCGQFSVSDIWQPTGQLVEDPIAEFSLPVAEGAMQLSGASFGETVTVTGYENNEFTRDFEVAVATSSSPTSLRIEPTISWDSLNTMLEFRNDGSLSLPVANGRGSAAHLFKDTFLFFKEANRGSALGLSHASGLSIAFERETDSFFGSIGSGSYEFGDTNKFVASFDRQFNLNETYGVGVKLAAAYGEMEPDISLIKSAKGTAQTAQVAFVRKRNNFESRLEMNYNTGLKGTVSIQNTDYRLKPRSETAVMLKMRFVM